MKWIGQHIWSFISRFRNTIYIEKTPTQDTTSSNALVLMGDGEIRINPNLGGSGSSTTTHIHEDVRNDEGSALSVGDPVYAIGEVGNSGVIRVGKADASNANKMPAIGILDQNLNTEATGTATLVGVFNTNISGFTGVEPGQVIYVDDGGGLTNVKPSGESNLLQNVGIVLKTNEENTMIQGLQVTVVGRTNATPNLDHNAIFLGDSTNCSVATDAPMVSVITAANGTDAKAELGAIDLTSEVTGTLDVANGGTGETDLNNVRVGEASEARVRLGSGSSQHALVFIDNAGPTAGGSYETLEGNGNLHYVPQTGKLTAPRFNGNLEGDIYSRNGNNKVLDAGTDGSSAWFMGDIYANNGTSKILESGTDGTNATFTGNASSASILETARTIGGVSFDGSANINLPGVNTTGNQDTSGNAATATALETARTINGVSFDGTQNITVSTDVTLAGTPDYITISGQEITRNQIDLSTDVTGILPAANGGTGQNAIGGANTQVQYNNNGVLAGNSSFTFTTSPNKVTVGGFEATDSTLIFSGITSTSTPESHVIGIDANGNLKKQTAASGDGSPAGQGSGNDKPIQFNDEGSFGADGDDLYWKSDVDTLVSTKLATTQIHFGSSPPDTTISRSGTSSVKLGDGSTGFSDLQAGTITATLHSSVTGTTQSQGDNSTKIATTAYVDAAAVPAGSNTQIQYNDNGSFGTNFSFYFDASTYTVHAVKFDATNLEGALTSNSTLSNGVTAATQTAGDSSTKVATTAFVTNAITNAAGTPAGANYQIQYYDNAGFGATSEVTINPTTGYISAEGLNLYDTTANVYSFWNNGDTALAGTRTAISSSQVTLSGLSTASTPESNVVGIASNGQLFKQPAGGTPAGDGTGTILPLQFNNDGSFAAVSTVGKLGWNTDSEALYTQNFYTLNGGTVVNDFSCFGNIELGNATDTTLSRTSAGTVAIEGKEIVTLNKMRQAFCLNFYDGIGTDEHWLSWRDQYEATSALSDAVDTEFMCPANGRLHSVTFQVGSVSGTAGFTRTFALYRQIGGFPFEQVDSSTTVASDDDLDRFVVFFTGTDNFFNAGDKIKISIQNSTTLESTSTHYITAVLEFDYTDMGRTDSGKIY